MRLDQSRGRTMSSRARGNTAELHGTLQRLLGAGTFTFPTTTQG